MRRLAVLLLTLLACLGAARAFSASSPTTLEAARRAVAGAHAAVLADESALTAARAAETAAQGVVAAIEAEAPKEEPGTVLWYGDGVHGPLSSQWAAVSDQANCAQVSSEANTNTPELRPVSDLRFAKVIGVAFHINGGTPCFSGRDELAQGNPYSTSKTDRRFYPGHTYDFAWQAIFPAAYPFDGSGGGGLVQVHRTYNGKSPFGLGVGKGSEPGVGKLILYVDEGPAGPFTETPIGTIRAETAYSFAVEYDAQATATGSFRVYESEAPSPPVLVAERSGLPTILPDQSGSPTGPNFLTAGLYPGNVNNQELRMAGFTVASTLAAAEANALH